MASDVSGTSALRARQDDWVRSVLLIHASKRGDIEQDFDDEEGDEAEGTETTGKESGTSTTKPEDPHRLLFAQDWLKKGSRIEYWRDLENENPKIRAAQDKIRTALALMEKAREEKAYEVARGHMNDADKAATETETAQEEAGKSERDFHIAYQAVSGRRQAVLDSAPPTEWTKKAKAVFLSADTILQAHIGKGEWDQATLALPKVATALGDFDKAARQELTSQIAMLKSWPEAKIEGETLEAKLAKLTDPLLGTQAYPSLANEIREATDGWRDLRTHKIEMAKLAQEFAPIARIPGKDDGGSPLKAEWDSFKTAKTLVGDPTAITTTTDHDKLLGLRSKYAAAGRALMKAYEAGTGGTPGVRYLKEVTAYVAGENGLLLRQGNKVPSDTPQIALLKQEMNTLNAQTGTTAEITAAQRKVGETARQLMALRTATKDPAEVTLFGKYRKAETSLEAALKGVPNAGATPEQVEYKRRYVAFKAKLFGKDEDRVAVCGPELDWIVPAAEALLLAATTALKLLAANVKAMAQGSAPEQTTKATAAQNAIDGADPAILSRLGPDEQLDLLEGLRVAGMPAFDIGNKDASKADPKRTAQRKMFHAIKLDDKFMAADDKKHDAMMTALEGMKQELKDARDNWPSMPDDQRVDMLRRVMDAQNTAFGIDPPSGGITTFSDGASTNNGGYSRSDMTRDPPVNDPDQDIIKLNVAKPVFKDFEAAMDLIIHENMHCNQNRLVRALKWPKGPDPKYLTKDNSDPPWTQARLFAATYGGGANQCGPKEDHPTYKKQPVEDHAWIAGPRGTQGIMDMLDKD